MWLFIPSNETVACQWFLSHAAVVIWKSCISDAKRNPHLCAGLQKVIFRPRGFVSGTKPIWVKTWDWARYHLSFPLPSSWHNFDLWQLALSETMPRNSPGKSMCRRPFSIHFVNSTALGLLPLSLHCPSDLLPQRGRKRHILSHPLHLSEMWQHSLWELKIEFLVEARGESWSNACQCECSPCC